MLVRIEGMMTTLPESSTQGRKVIQVSSGSETNPVIAVCNDGSMWSFNKQANIWSRMPDVPQD
jgi:hypothetical protein